jgi:hypothetical protein
MKTLTKSVLLLFLTSACANLSDIDRSLVNAPNMDINKIDSLRSVPPHTGLKVFTQSVGGAGCSVCAH